MESRLPCGEIIGQVPTRLCVSSNGQRAVRAADFPRLAITERWANPERPYLSALPTSSCTLELPGIRLSVAFLAGLPPPQAVKPRAADAIARAPTVTFRDLVFILSSFPVYETDVMILSRWTEHIAESIEFADFFGIPF
jgi:hypothetical protein